MKYTCSSRKHLQWGRYSTSFSQWRSNARILWLPFLILAISCCFFLSKWGASRASSQCTWELNASKHTGNGFFKNVKIFETVFYIQDISLLAHSECAVPVIFLLLLDQHIQNKRIHERVWPIKVALCEGNKQETDKSVGPWLWTQTQLPPKLRGCGSNDQRRGWGLPSPFPSTVWIPDPTHTLSQHMLPPILSPQGLLPCSVNSWIFRFHGPANFWKTDVNNCLPIPYFANEELLKGGDK